MLIKFFCSFLQTSSATHIRVGDSEDLTVYDLTIAIYKEHLMFKRANVSMSELEFFALVRLAGIETHFSK